jgi:hypothetical protein
VRLSKAKRTFKKGYLPNWNEELFMVVKCIETRPPVYLVKDDHGEILEGDFLGPFLPYSLLDTVAWLAHVTSAGGMPMVL